MKKKILGALFAALLMGAPLPAAAGPTYDYIELGLASGGYNWADLCVPAEVSYYANGFQVAGSMSIGDSWFVDGRYNTLSMDVADGACAGVVGLDASTIGLNFGWHSENWYAKLGYESYDYFCEVGVCFPDETGTGYAIDGGYRGSLSDAIEYSAHIGYADLDIATAIRYGFGFAMLLGDSWGVSMSYDLASYDFDQFGFTEDSNLITVNARFQW